MNFGEIIEPTTRALWDEDLDTDLLASNEYSNNLTWKISNEVPAVIHKLVVCETSCIEELVQQCLLDTTSIFCSLTSGDKIVLNIFKLPNNVYVSVLKDLRNIVSEVTEKLIPWLNTAQQIQILTSAFINSLQNCADISTAPCLIRSLSSCKSNMFDAYPKLEVPNIITGFSASVLSYCVFKQLQSWLYISYIDKESLDSINAAPIVELLRKLEIGTLKPYSAKTKPVHNNLYM